MSPRHVAAAGLAAVVLATRAGCGFTVTTAGPGAPGPAGSPSTASSPPAAAAPETPPPAPDGAGAAPDGGSPVRPGRGVDCAGNPVPNTIHMDATSASTERAADRTLYDVDVTGHPSTVFCGGPTGLRYDADRTQTTILLEEDTRAMTSLSGVPATFTERHHP